jgi:hypothetical protein
MVILRGNRKEEKFKRMWRAIKKKLETPDLLKKMDRNSRRVLFVGCLF